MITKFSVSNFKNFKNKLTFDLNKSKNYEFNTNCVDNGTIKKALIYGHNGVGKSNLGFAMFDIVSHLTDKTASKEIYKNYINAANSKDTIAEFKYEFNFNGISLIYEYGKTDVETLVYENLKINNSDYASIDRRNNNTASFNAKGTENLQTDIGKSKISILTYIKKNSVLTDSIENECFFSFIEYINGILFFRSLEQNNYIGFEQGVRGIAADIIEHDNIEDFQGFLNEAGIDCKLRRIEDVNTPSLAFDFNGNLINFYEIASQGTKALSLFYYWFQRLREKDSLVTFLFIDEFDAFYHHTLSALIVKKLCDINAQVVLTTHNTSIITNDLMRPDCYFLLNHDGLHSLADRTPKELRKAHNIEKMYKAGAFNG